MRFHTRAGADFIMIPERPPEAGKWQEQMCEAIGRVGFFFYGRRASPLIRDL